MESAKLYCWLIYDPLLLLNIVISFLALLCFAGKARNSRPLPQKGIGNEVDSSSARGMSENRIQLSEDGNNEEEDEVDAMVCVTTPIS